MNAKPSDHIGFRLDPIDIARTIDRQLGKLTAATVHNIQPLIPAAKEELLRHLLALGIEATVTGASRSTRLSVRRLEETP